MHFFILKMVTLLSLSYEDNEYEYYNVVCYTDLINKRKNKSVNDQKVYNDL